MVIDVREGGGPGRPVCYGQSRHPSGWWPGRATRPGAGGAIAEGDGQWHNEGPGKIYKDRSATTMTGLWQQGRYADAVQVASGVAGQGNVGAQAIMARAYYI